MKIFEIIAEDKKTWTKDGVEMCSKKCCGEPVTECTCGKDCKHCECYKINEAKLNEAGPAIIPMIIGVFEVANVTYTAYQMYKALKKFEKKEITKDQLIDELGADAANGLMTLAGLKGAKLTYNVFKKAYRKFKGIDPNAKRPDPPMTKEKTPVDPGPIAGKPTPGKIRQANKLKPNLDLRPRPMISKNPRSVEPRIK